MVSNFFDSFSAKEKQAIRDRTDTLVELLEKWAQRYSYIRTVRIPPIALHNAIVMSRLDPSDSALLAKLTLWIFGIDDKIDERLITLAEMRRKAEQWYSIANRGSSNEMDDGDELTTILLEMRKELSKFHLFEPLREYWASRLRLLIEAMVQEHQYGLEYNAHGAYALPSLDEYLQNGIYSIGIPLWATMILIILSDSSVEECFESTGEATRCASAAMRLYNDVQTCDREMQEKTINSVVIMYHAMLGRNPNAVKEDALSKAKHYIWQMADSYAQRCYDLARQIQTESGQFEEIICRSVAFHGHFFYREHDYHTTPMAKVNEFLGMPQSTD